MGTRSPRPLTLDSGGLIAIVRGDRRVRALLSLATLQSVPLYLPTAVIAEVWRGGTGRQARLASFLNTAQRSGYLSIVDLDTATARLVGLLLARAGAADAGVTDGMVAWCALRFDTRILTSDPDDLARLVARDRLIPL